MDPIGLPPAPQIVVLIMPATPTPYPYAGTSYANPHAVTGVTLQIEMRGASIGPRAYRRADARILRSAGCRGDRTDCGSACVACEM
jgi:hypothetical protein